MSFKYELKKWLTIEEAAQLLSSSLNDFFDVQDVLYFVLDDRLNVFWGLRNAFAQEVAVRNHLCFGYFALAHPDEYTPGPEWAENTSWKEMLARVDDNPAHPYKCRPDAKLNGIYRLNLEVLTDLLDHLSRVPVNHENRHPYEVRLIGTVVFDGNDRIYELLEAEEISERGQHYEISFRVPELSELLFEKEEIQNFVRASLMREVVSESQSSHKSKNAMLKTIQALSFALLKGSSGSHYTDAEGCFAEMRDNKIDSPVQVDTLARYLKQAGELK